MPVAISAIDRFQALKKRRDLVSHQLATLTGKLDSSRDRYNQIMHELAGFGIGSLDELRKQIGTVNTQIEAELTKAEGLLVQMEAELSALDNQEAGTPVAR